MATSDLLVAATIVSFSNTPTVQITMVGTKAVVSAHVEKHGGEVYPTIAVPGGKRRAPRVGDRLGTFARGDVLEVVWPDAGAQT